MTTKRILQASLVIFFFLVIAKLLNFVKKILIGQLFGVSWVADAFFAASFLPYYLGIFFEGLLFLCFLPLFSKRLSQKGEEEADSFLGGVFLLLVLLTAVWVVLAWFFAPFFVRELVPGFNSREQDLTCSLFRILSFVVFFISLRSFFQALNSYFGRNALAGSSGLTDTLTMIIGTLFTWRIWGIHAAAWSAVLGMAVTLLVQAIPFKDRLGSFFTRTRFRLDWLQEFLYFLFPMGAIWALQQVPLVILNRFASGMWEGTISALTLSQALTTVPMGLVSHTVLIAIFPTLAKQVGEPPSDSLKETFFHTLRGGFLILVPVGFLLTALARPLAGLFFGGGGISGEGTVRVANSLACFGWAAFALYADLFMTQSLIGVRRTGPAIFLSGSRAVLTYVTGYVLSSIWDYQGLAFSFSLALVVNFFVLFPLFFRMSPFKGAWGDLFVYTAKLFLASTPILLMGGMLSQWSPAEWMGFSRKLLFLTLAGGTLLGGAVYLGLIFLLRVHEIHAALKELRKLLSRQTEWIAETAD